MGTIAIAISDDRLNRLEEISARLLVTPEELVRASVDELLTRPEETFREALDRVLKKNAELYQRLA